MVSWAGVMLAMYEFDAQWIPGYRDLSLQTLWDASSWDAQIFASTRLVVDRVRPWITWTIKLVQTNLDLGTHHYWHPEVLGSCGFCDSHSPNFAIPNSAFKGGIKGHGTESGLGTSDSDLSINLSAWAVIYCTDVIQHLIKRTMTFIKKSIDRLKCFLIGKIVKQEGWHPWIKAQNDL